MARRALRPELLLLLLAACRLGTEGGPADGGGPGAPVIPTATAPGTPQGAPVAATIGAGGGVLTTPDGALRLTVPAGAVTAPTEFTATPISSRAPGALGTSWRIEASRPLGAPVALAFKGLGTYRTGLDLRALAIRYQDAAGFWRAPAAAAYDPAADAITVTTPHLSDWATVLAGTPALEGTFTLTQAVGIPFTATGTAALFAWPAATEPTYFVTGTVTLPGPLTAPGVTCVPDAATKDLELSVAEVSGAVFRWGINARWALTCTDTATGALSSRELATLFDTMRINLVRCGGQYLGTQVNGPAFVQGSYGIDCGADGTVTASWDLRSCVAGGACQPADPCLTGTVSCSLGVGTCTPGPAAPPGTSCGTDQVCSAAGVCQACQAGVACVPDNPCDLGAISCATGAPACADTGSPAANGMPCATPTVPAGTCLDGVCQ